MCGALFFFLEEGIVAVEAMGAMVALGILHFVILHSPFLILSS